MRRRVVIGVSAVVLLALAGIGGVAAWRFLDKAPFEQAVAWMPPQTLRATYTDWSQVRSLTGSVDTGSSSREVDELLDRAYEADLISTSAVTGSIHAMEEKYGFSPLGASWEMYGQSREGAVDVLKMREADLAAVEDNLRRLGYEEPSGGAGSGGVWAGSVDLVAQVDSSLSPVLQNVVVLPDHDVVLMSDNAAYASMAADVVEGGGSSLWSEPGVPELAGVPSEPVSAVFFASDFACEALSMASADEEDQRVADELVTEAGEIAPLTGLVMAHERDRSLVVGMQFESSDQAEENLRSRVRLASGDAVGQGGSFADRFRIASAEVDDETAVLSLEPVGSAEQKAESTLLSDLSQGPVLFATC